jgi:transcriptional regulator with XRE-family HTH domain
MIATPSVRRRIVGAALRRYRQELGFGLDDSARLLECDRSKISRIETGQRGIRNRELRDLLTEYGASKQVQDVLAMIANPRRMPGWWSVYTDVLPDTNHDYFALEMTASQIMIFAAQQVPSLLQTGEYASAVAVAARNVSAAQSERLSEAYQARQYSVLDGSRPAIMAVIGEAALRQVVGGHDVMHAQLGALADASSRFPGVSVRVLPFTSGAQTAGDTNSFTILRYVQVPDLGVAYLPGISGGAFFEDQPDVETGTAAFERLKACALDPDRSAQLIRDIQETYAGDQLAAGGIRR